MKSKHRDEGKYAGEYRYDEATGIISGCPARAQSIRDLVKAVRARDKKKGAAASRNHAEALSIEDLQRFMNWSEAICPNNMPSGCVYGEQAAGENLIYQPGGRGPSLKMIVEHTFMCAFASMAFTL